MTDTPASQPSAEIVATAGTYYRWTRYLMTLLLIGGGLWFMYDGYIGWPGLNQQIDETEQAKNAAEDAGQAERATELYNKWKQLGDKKSDMSILIQRLLGWGLPPLGLALIIWTLYNSRGKIRLTTEDVLHVPGHPPVPIGNIQQLDPRLWDRKGIAFAEYALPDGRSGRLRLDDFIYERPPIDSIYDRIKSRIVAATKAENTENAAAHEQLPAHESHSPATPPDDES